MQAVTLLTAGGRDRMEFICISSDLLTHRAGSRWGCLRSQSPPRFLLFISTRTLSEMPFALLVVAALWRVEDEIRKPPGSWASQFLTGIVVALPYLCRSIGVVFVVAGLLVLVVRRRPLLGTLLESRSQQDRGCIGA
jgi:hypothetical protein